MKDISDFSEYESIYFEGNNPEKIIDKKKA